MSGGLGGEVEREVGGAVAERLGDDRGDDAGHRDGVGAARRAEGSEVDAGTERLDRRDGGQHVRARLALHERLDRELQLQHVQSVRGRRDGSDRGARSFG